MTTKMLTLVISTLALAACSSVKLPWKKDSSPTIVVPEYVVKLPPDTLLQNCTIPKPPTKDVYPTLSWYEKEHLWVEGRADAYRALRECNARMQALREWKAEQEKLYLKPKEEQPITNKKAKKHANSK